MSKIGDLVREAQEQYAKAQKSKEAIAKVREAIITLHDISQIKGKE